ASCRAHVARTSWTPRTTALGPVVRGARRPGTGGTGGPDDAQSHAGTGGDADDLCHPCQAPIPDPPGDERADRDEDETTDDPSGDQPKPGVGQVGQVPRMTPSPTRELEGMQTTCPTCPTPCAPSLLATSAPSPGHTLHTPPRERAVARRGHTETHHR